MVEAIVGWGFRVGSGILCLVADMFRECFGRVERDCLRRILYSRATRYFHTTNIANGNPSCFFNPRVLFIYRLLRKSKSMY